MSRVLLAILLVLSCALPPWAVCWHTDGTACAEARGCCEDERAPDPCSDCLDVEHAPGLTAGAPPACDWAPGPAVPVAVPVLATPWRAALVADLTRACADPPAQAAPLRI